MASHTSDGRSFEADRNGFFMARCSCRWKFGPLPDEETVTDVLMGHAYEVGIRDGMKEARRG